MTLGTRNKLILWVFTSATIILLLYLAYGTYLFLAGILAPFPADPFEFHTIPHILFSHSYYIGTAGVFLLSLYACVMGFVLLVGFEKTHAPEVLYFGTFLLGVFFESFRLAIPLFNLWTGYSTFLSYIGRAAFAGHLLAMLSLLFTTLPLTENQLQDTDKNIGLSICAAILFAAIIPTSGDQVLPSLTIPYAFTNMFLTIRLVLYMLALFTTIASNRFKDLNGFLVLYGGYLLLSRSAGALFSFFGFVLLVTGSILYVKRIHTHYLWK